MALPKGNTAWEARGRPGPSLGILRDGWVCRIEMFQKDGLGAWVPQAWGYSSRKWGARKATGRRWGTASAGRGGPCAQLVGVVGVFAVVGAQVLAEAECSRLVTLAGLSLAGSSAC